MTAVSLAAGDALRLLNVSGAGTEKDAMIVISELVKALSGYNVQGNAAGNSNVSVAGTAFQHTEILTITGVTLTTRTITLLTSTQPIVGARCVVRCEIPNTTDITIEFRNATPGGTLLTSLVSDGSGDDAVVEFVYDGAAWKFIRFNYPANA